MQKTPQFEYRDIETGAVLTEQQVRQRSDQSGLPGTISLDEIGVKMVRTN